MGGTEGKWLWGGAELSFYQHRLRVLLKMGPWDVDYSPNSKHILPYPNILREFVLFVTETFVM